MVSKKKNILGTTENECFWKTSFLYVYVQFFSAIHISIFHLYRRQTKKVGDGGRGREMMGGGVVTASITVRSVLDILMRLLCKT